MSQRLLLLLDWDGTLTPKTTLTNIARIRPASAPTFSPDADLLAPYTRDYIRDLDTHKARSLSPPTFTSKLPSGTTYLPQDKNERSILADEMTYLLSMESIERDSIQRMEKHGLWKDVTAADIDNAAAQEKGVPLRPGAKALIERVQSAGGLVAVVSVSWSARWIAGVLRGHGVNAVAVEGRGQIVEMRHRVGEREMLVFANEICGDGSGLLSRGLPTTPYFGWEHRERGSAAPMQVGEADPVVQREKDRGLWTALDKHDVMCDLGSELITKEPEKEWRVVYVGDSTTDLGCIARADLGVYTHTKEVGSLERVIERLGWSVNSKHGRVFDGTGEEQSLERWKIEDFGDLEALMFGLDVPARHSSSDLLFEKETEGVSGRTLRSKSAF